MARVSAPVCAVALLVLVATPGSPRAIDVQPANRLHRSSVIVTDAQHAALVMHAGKRPLVIPPSYASHPAPPTSRASRLRARVDPSLVWIALLLGLVVGALLASSIRPRGLAESGRRWVMPFGG